MSKKVKVTNNVPSPDITERKEIEEALQESEEWYRDLLENANDLIQSVAPDGHFLYVNKMWREILGYSEGEVANLTLWDIIHPDFIPHCREVFQKVTSGETVNNIEAVFVAKDGRLVTVEGSANCRFKGGEPLATRGIFRDITKRKRMEETLRQSEENLGAYLESAPDGVYLNDLKGKFLYGNKKAEELTGYEREELVGKSFLKLNLLSAKHLAKAGKLLALNAMGRPTGPDEFELTRKDGRRIWVEINTTPIKQEGKVVVIGFVRDITERKRMEDLLKESQKRYLDLVNLLPQTIFEMDERGNLIFANRQGTLAFGYTLEDVQKGLNALEFFIPEDRDRVRKNVYRILSGEQESGANEYTALRKDGSTFPVISYSSAIIRENKPAGLIGVLMDITERKRMERDLGERVKELQCLYGIARIAERPEISLDELYQEVVNILPASWQYPESIGARIAINGKESKTENYRDTEWKQSSAINVYGTKAGEVEVSYLEERPGFDEGPFLKEERWLIDAVAQRLGDITERKRAEEALRQSEKNYKTLFESKLEGVFVIDAETMQVVLTNEAAARMYGFDSAEDAVGMNPLDFIPPEDRERVIRLIAEDMFEKDLRQVNEFRTITKDGREIWVSAMGVRTEYEGRLAGLASFRDITDRKRMELELREKNEQLDAQNEELQSQSEELMTQQQELMEKTREVEKATRLKSEFLANMSHELRTPLNVIIGFSQLMVDEVPGEINEEQRQSLNDILDSSQCLLNLINEVLDLSKIESGKMELKPKDIALTEVIKSLTRTMMPILAPRKQSLDIEIEEGLPPVRADKAKLGQVFLNLVDNSSKFTPDGGKLKIEAVRKGDWCQVSVIDNGVGIKQEDQERIFEPFCRLDDPLTKGRSGTGLGLVLVKQIVERYGGRIWVESEHGKGSRFTITVSLAASGQPNPEERDRR